MSVIHSCPFRCIICQILTLYLDDLAPRGHAHNFCYGSIRIPGQKAGHAVTAAVALY